jgi:hypothetical protein
MYRADDGSLHETRKQWRSRQSWLDLVHLMELVTIDTSDEAAAAMFLSRRDEVTRLLRHAVEPTEEA